MPVVKRYDYMFQIVEMDDEWLSNGKEFLGNFLPSQINQSFGIFGSKVFGTFWCDSVYCKPFSNRL